MNHILGSYIAKAYHEPNKYPKKAISEKEKKNIQMAYTDKQREIIVRAKYGKKGK